MVQECSEQRGRLQVVLGGELEGAPVDAEGLAAADVLVDLHGLARVHVVVLHEPVWLVRADGDGRHGEGSVLFPDLAEQLGAVAGVAPEPEAGVGPEHGPAAPQHRHGVTQRPLAPVVGRGHGHPHLRARQLGLLPPAQLPHLCGYYCYDEESLVILVSDDEAKILQMEVETDKEASKNVNENSETNSLKVNEVSYGVFYKNFEKELENIKKFVDKQKRMDVDKIQNIKEMFTKIGKDYRFSKRTQNMRNRSNVFERIWKQTVEKIVNSENSKFRKITSAEIQKLMKLCKNEQNIVN